MGYVLVVGYIVAAIFLYDTVMFWVAAVLDFLLMLLVVGLIALIHRKDLGQDNVWISIRAERPLGSSGVHRSESKPKAPTATKTE